MRIHRDITSTYRYTNRYRSAEWRKTLSKHFHGWSEIAFRDSKLHLPVIRLEPQRHLQLNLLKSQYFLPCLISGTRREECTCLGKMRQDTLTSLKVRFDLRLRGWPSVLTDAPVISTTQIMTVTTHTSHTTL